MTKLGENTNTHNIMIIVYLQVDLSRRAKDHTHTHARTTHKHAYTCRHRREFNNHTPTSLPINHYTCTCITCLIPSLDDTEETGNSLNSLSGNLTGGGVTTMREKERFRINRIN